VLPLLEGSTWPNATEALAQVHTLPIPTTRTEAWKYTRVGKLFNQPYTAPKGDATVTLPARLPFDTTRVVFVNGHFRADLSDDLKTDKGIVIDSLKHHLAHGPVKAHYGQIRTHRRSPLHGNEHRRTHRRPDHPRHERDEDQQADPCAAHHHRWPVS
jgi:hypothetical protein